MLHLAKLLLVLLAVIAIVGGLILYAGHFHLGHLPGDFVYHNGRTPIYVPATTALLFTAVISVGFWIYHRIR